ncbi:MAG: ATP-grasp domain-containing protein [Cyanobacteria bacterium J06638_28]
MKIFNHDIALYTHDQSPGTDLYSGRALGLSKPEDKIQIHGSLQPEWDAITEHYAQVGIRHSHDVIWDVALTHIDQHPDYEPCFYFFGDVVNSHATYRQFFERLDAPRCQVIDFVNSKNNFVHLAEELGVPVPRTLRFQTVKEAQECDSLPFPCYVKPAVSDHGFGIMRCEDQPALARALAQLHPNEPLQVQAEVPAAAFLNLQYRATAEGVMPLLASEQILDGCVHGGNRYPTPYEPWAIVQPFADWMRDHGMQGIFAVDVAVVPEGDQISYCAIECNPRFNGSSYPTLVAQRLRIPAWSSATYTTPKRSLREIELRDLAFDPTTGEGVIVINWGTIQVGKISVLLAGSRQVQTKLASELKAILQPQMALV